jgi:hypothetical protein
MQKKKIVKFSSDYESTGRIKRGLPKKTWKDLLLDDSWLYQLQNPTK